MELYSFLASEKDYDMKIKEKAFWKAKINNSVLFSKSYLTA